MDVLERIRSLVQAVPAAEVTVPRAWLLEVIEIADSRPDDLLTLEAASAVSGYSADHLSRLLRQGKIPNAGRKHSPRIKRSSLPRKIRCLTSEAPVIHLADARQVARRVAEGGGHHA